MHNFLNLLCGNTIVLVMDFYKFKNVTLSTIFHDGTSSINDYTTGTTTLVNIKGLITSKADSRPLPTGYLNNGTDLSNIYAAKHIPVTTSSNIIVPSNATHLRYMIIGGSGGGGGGGGGGYCNDTAILSDPEDHALRGFDGTSGLHGEVKSAKVQVTAGTTITVVIGNGGSGGPGGAGVYVKNGNANLKAGGNGTNGGDSTIEIPGISKITAKGGPFGYGGIVTYNGYTRRVEEDRGHGTSYNGSFSGSTNDSIWGSSDNFNTKSTGNVTPTASSVYSFLDNMDNALTGISGSNQSGGAGGSGGATSSITAQNGVNGGSGSPGRAVLVWLYE